MTEYELTWPAVDDEGEYRILVRELAGGKFVVDRATTQTAWTVAPATLRAQARHTWQVRWHRAGESDWRQVLPELPLEADRTSGTSDTTVLEWKDRGAAAYRVLIRDQAPDGVLLKLPVVGCRHVVDWSTLPARPSYRWRVQAWDAESGGWLDLGPYAPLPAPARLPTAVQLAEDRRNALAGVPTRTADPAAAGGSKPPVLLMFTVDTEATLQYIHDPDPRRAIDDHIFCRDQEGNGAGIEMIMDALDTHGFKGTFFLDILAEYQFGEGSLERVVDAIGGRGHDIQLHLHTAPHLRFAADPSLRELSTALSSLDGDRFRRALELAIDRFVRRVGTDPVAFRSGAYWICDDYLRVLPEFGLRIDSSVYPFKNCDVSPWMRARTQPFRVGPMLEIPVSWRLEWRAAGSVPMQFAPYRTGGDNNQSFTRQSAAADQPPLALVYLAHSYQYLTRGSDADAEQQAQWHRTLARRVLRSEHAGGYDRTDPPWFFGGPDASRIELLKLNLAELAGRGDVAGVSMRDVADRLFHCWDDRLAPVDPLPEFVDEVASTHLTATRVYSSDYLRHLA